MGARELLGDLADIGVTVRAVGGNLVIQPAGVITDAHRAEVRARKPELLVLLQAAVPQAAAPSNTRQATAAPSSADRPYKLMQADMAAAHAEPWNEGVTARFLARAAAIRRRGFAEQHAEDLAERLHLLDVQAEARVLCLDCRHLSGTAASGWRCGNHRIAGVGRELPAEWVTLAQRCFGHAGIHQPEGTSS